MFKEKQATVSNLNFISQKWLAFLVEDMVQNQGNMGENKKNKFRSPE